MYYDESSATFNFLTGLAVGVVIGAGIAVLMAPQSGKRTRKRVRRIAGTARETAVDQLEDLAGELRSAVGGGRKRFPF